MEKEHVKVKMVDYNYLGSKSTQRNSSVEMLKILAIIMIVFSHSMPITENPNIIGNLYLMDISSATYSFQRLIIVLGKWGGQLGNSIFLVCSAWFLSDAIGKTFYKKIFRLWADTLGIYAIILVVFAFFRYPITFNDVISCIFPVWMGSSWFVTCFIVYLLLVPVLTTAVNFMPVKTLRSLVISLFCVYCILQFIRKDSFYYSHLIGFICIYFITVYVKKSALHNEMFGVKTLILAILGNFFLFAVTNFVGLKFGILSNDLLKWCKFINPFLVIIAISLLNICLKYTICNKAINYLASLSLLVYLFHNNKLVMDYLIAHVWDYIYVNWGYEKELAWYIIVSLILLFFAFCCSILYDKFVRRVTYKISDCLYLKIGRSLGEQ